MNIITPLILIIISLTAFFGYIDPSYRGDNLSGGRRSIQSLQAEDNEYKITLNNTTAIREKRQGLVEKRSKIDPVDLLKLESLLPDNIDNIKLVIDIKNIAENHGLVMKNIALDPEIKSNPGQLGQDNSKYGTVGLSFSVNSSYDNFQNFLGNLEKSLRLVEVVGLSVTGNDTGLYDFSIKLRTYWLK